MWAEKQPRAKAKLITAVKLGIGSRKVTPEGNILHEDGHIESKLSLNDFRLSDKDRAIKKERVRKMSGKIASLF